LGDNFAVASDLGFREGRRTRRPSFAATGDIPRGMSNSEYSMPHDEVKRGGEEVRGDYGGDGGEKREGGGSTGGGWREGLRRVLVVARRVERSPRCHGG